MRFLKRGVRKSMLFYHEIRIPHPFEPGGYIFIEYETVD